MKTLRVRTLEHWRDWLTEHHASASQVWLIFQKRHRLKEAILLLARGKVLGLK